MRYKLSNVGMVRENHEGFINGSGNELLIDNYKFIEINHGKYVIEFDYCASTIDFSKFESSQELNTIKAESYWYKDPNHPKTPQLFDDTVTVLNPNDISNTENKIMMKCLWKSSSATNTLYFVFDKVVD